jgi:hypothetical protein
MLLHFLSACYMYSPIAIAARARTRPSAAASRCGRRRSWARWSSCSLSTSSSGLCPCFLKVLSDECLNRSIVTRAHAPRQGRGRQTARGLGGAHRGGPGDHVWSENIGCPMLLKGAE